MFIWRLVWYYKKQVGKKNTEMFIMQDTINPQHSIYGYTLQGITSQFVYPHFKVSNQNCYITELCIHIIY